RRESFLVQGSLVAAIAALVSAGLLLVWFLDHPYSDQSGSIRPTEMERQLEIVEHEQRNVVPPCDSAGERPRVEWREKAIRLEIIETEVPSLLRDRERPQDVASTA